MMTWLRMLLVTVTVSAPLVGCSAQIGSGPAAEPAHSSQQEQALDEAPGRFAKGTPSSVEGKFSQWIVTPAGEVSAMLLDDGTIAMVPHRAAKSLTEATLRPGDVVRVDGHRREGSPVVRVASVKKGDAFVIEPRPFKDRAHPHKGGFGKGGFGKKAKPHKANDFAAEALSPASATGSIVAIVSGKHGKARALVLSDGTAAYAPRGTKLSELGLKKGDSITITGRGGSFALGRALVIESVKLPSGETRELPGKR